MPLGMEVGLDTSNIVLDRDPVPPSPKKGQSPHNFFSAHAYCGQTDEWIKMPLGMEVGLGPGHIVLDGDQAPLPKRGEAPSFRPMSMVASTAGWIKMPLGMEVGLGPGHIVQRGTQLPSPKKGAQHPIFGAYLLWLNGWTDEDAA